MSKVRADNYSNRLGTGAPVFPDGANITGVCTATSFKGDGSTLSNVVTSTDFIAGIAATFTGNVSIAGTLTYQDVSNVDAIGVITARSGVSIGDSIFHTGDTNTAIRFPAADTFTVETGGSEALRVDSSQRLLIGETSVVLDSSNALLQIGAAAGANMVLYRDDSSVTTDDSLGLIRFYSNAGSSKQEHARITATAGAASGDGDKPGNLLFYTTADGASSPTERLRITSDGKIGVNQSTPQTTFHSSGTTNGQQATFGISSSGLKISTFQKTDNDAGVILDAQKSSNGTLTFATAGTERFRIHSAGAAIFKGGLAEKYENAGTTLGIQTSNPLSDGNVILFTGNESGNTTINFTGVHATISNGETVSFTVILTPNNSGVINVVQVDGQAITVKWSGGSAPSAGASGQDIYTFQILKTGTGTSDYTVFGAATNYA